MKNVRYNDLIRLLDIDQYNQQDWSVFPKSKMIREDIKVGLGKKLIKLADKYDIHLGMNLNSIPKVMKDQPLVRIEQVLDERLNGLATINSYDLRVTLQRDYDGDHGFKHLKMPMDMLKDYADDMGDITDYKPMDDLIYTPMNMFGFKDGVAGKVRKDIGFDRVAHDVAKKKRIISSVISKKGTLSYLLSSNLKLDGNSFVSEEFNKKNVDAATTKALDVFQRGGEIFQASLDFWKKTPKISEERKAVENYFIYGEHPNYLDPGAAQSKASFLQKGFGSTDFHKDMFSIMHRVLAKARIMDNDVHDAAGQRQPTTEELRRSRRNIRSFYKDPDLFLMRELLGNARRLRKPYGNRAPDIDGADRIVKNIIDFFYKDVSAGSANINKVYKSLERGKIPIANRRQRFTAEKSLGIKSSMSGHILDEVIRNPVFHQNDNLNKSGAKNRTMFQHYDRLKNKLEVMFAWGDVNPDEIDNMIMNDKVFTEEVGGKRVFDSNMSGILRFVANKQYSRALGSLRMLNNEKFPDANKIERAKDRLSNLRVMVDALDRQMSRDVILRKKRDVFLKRMPAPTEDIKWEYIDFGAFGNLYRIRGDVKMKDLSPKKGLGSIEYIRPIKKGKKERVERGYTYLVDKRPPKFMSVDNPEVRWNKAFMAATGVGILNARDIQPGLNEHDNPIAFSRFVSDVNYLRSSVSDSYSRAIEGAKERLTDRSDIFYYNSVHTDRMIGRFFKDYSTTDNFHNLLKFLVQPQIQRNVYFKEGTLEMPYYRMDTHLIESVFNWMRRPATQQVKSNEEVFGFNAAEHIRSIINDMNAFHDHKLDHVEHTVQQYNRMKMGGKEDFNRLRETTTDILLKDWYHNPVLSKYANDFFLGRGDILRAKDTNGRDSYFYDYRRGNVIREMEKIMGCK